MKKLALGLFLSLGLVACKPPKTDTKTPPDTKKIENPNPEPKPTPKPEATTPSKLTYKKLNADTKLSLASGATVNASAGWTVASSENALLLKEPDGELDVAVLSIKGKDAKASLKEAWSQLRPNFSIPEKQTTNVPARDGWDEIIQVEYDNPSKDNRTSIAIGWRSKDVWYVILLDGANAALDRRGAQVGTIIGSLTAPGVKEESFAGKKANVLDDAKLKSLETFIEDARVKLGVPGVSVAIVQGDKIVYEKGFGVKEAGKKDTVTPKTLFMIGSISKSITTLMMASLIDQKKFDWSTPVVSLYPEFALGDEEATKKLTVQNTVCACTGFPRQDMEFLFEFDGISAEKRLEDMKKMKPTTAFGETFQYSNAMVSAGGYIAAHAASPKKKLTDAYAETINKLLSSMGMKSTTFDTKVASKNKDHAMPHGRNLKNELTPIPLSYEGVVAAVGPAGGAWSNVEDMSRYLLIELNKGKTPEGKQIVSEQNILKRREPQIKINDKDSYGLGLMIVENRGAQAVTHGGNTLGFSADWAFLPEQGVGLVVLNNGQAENTLNSLIKRRLMELLFDGEEVAAQRLDFTVKQTKEDLAVMLAPINQTPDKEWLSTFVGEYQNESLGKIKISLDKDKGVFDAGEWKSAIGQKKEQDGTKKLILLDAPLAGLDFFIREENGKPSIVLELSQQKYVFTSTK